MQDDIPFGGVGPSGFGAYHGVEGFKALSLANGIFEQARWTTSGTVRPPFGWIANLAHGRILVTSEALARVTRST
jgi:coniferyl-aldehyde dehydrogenase